MQAKMDFGVKDLFEQAIDTWGGAMKASVKFQDDVARWWTQALSQANSAQEWQKKACAMMAEAIPAAQRNAEEALKLADQGYRSSLEIMRKAVENGRCQDLNQVQAKTQEMLQASLTAWRENAQALTQANMKAMESWAEIVRNKVGENGHTADTTAAAV